MSSMRFKYAVVLLMFALTWLYTQVYYKPISNVFKSKEFIRKIENFPQQVGDWKFSGNVPMDEISYKALNPQALIFRQYTNSNGESITLVVVFHENQRWGAHDVKVCYETQGWSTIKRNAIEKQKIQFKTRVNVTANKIEMENSSKKQTVVYWWFTQGKQFMARRLEQMVNNVKSSLLYGYCASGLVRISTEGVGKKPAALINNFAEELIPTLEHYLP